MLDVGLAIGLAVVCLLGMLLTVLQLPGTWLIIGAAAGYAWYGDWAIIGGWTVGGMIAIALAAELAELLTGVWFTRQGGGSRKAAWCGLVGGMAGALLLSIPVPMVGTIIGAAIGCFCGALLAELSVNKDAVHAARVGLLTAVGRTVGTMFKIAAAVTLAGIAIVSMIVGP